MPPKASTFKPTVCQSKCSSPAPASSGTNASAGITARSWNNSTEKPSCPDSLRFIPFSRINCSAIAVDDIATVEARLGREAVKGNRHRPDGTELLWQQIGVHGLISDPQLPFFIQWQSPAELHPSNGATGDFSLACLEIAGDPQRVSEWLGETVEAPLEDVKVDWAAPNGTPGIVAAQFQTPNGLVRL